MGTTILVYIGLDTSQCDWDGGERSSNYHFPLSYEFNLLYPGCLSPKVIPFFVGTGFCNCGDRNAPEFGYDVGHCLLVTMKRSLMQIHEISRFPNIVLSSLTQCTLNVQWKSRVGFCDFGLYNTTEFGYDGGDCWIALVQG